MKRDTVSKARLDALADAMFGVAMTLLVIDIRLPDDFSPSTPQEFLHGLFDLRSKILVYVVTFFVVGIRWIGSTHIAEGVERVSGRFARWTLLHLFLITCMPFSTMLVGRYEAFPVTAWIYAANMAFGAFAAMYLTMIAEQEGSASHAEGRDALWLLAASAALSVAISFYNPAHCMFAYLLNFLRPWLASWRRKSRGNATPG